jgi:hypothetical protein
VSVRYTLTSDCLALGSQIQNYLESPEHLPKAIICSYNNLAKTSPKEMNNIEQEIDSLINDNEELKQKQIIRKLFLV